MTGSLKVALAQLNPKVGDVDGNLAKVRAARGGEEAGAELVLTSELVLSGYSPEDLVLKPVFQKRCHEAVEALRTGEITSRAAHPLVVRASTRRRRRFHAVSFDHFVGATQQQLRYFYSERLSGLKIY